MKGQTLWSRAFQLPRFQLSYLAHLSCQLNCQRFEILDLGSRCNVLCRESKGMISCVVVMQLISVFVFRICKNQIFHDVGQMYIKEKP